MNRAQFLRELDRGLSGIPYDEKKEILADYEEHFRAGLAEGKTEEEISAALGSPRNLAKAYRADALVEQAQADKSAGNILRAIFAVISLSFFNLVIVLGPFMGLVGVLMGLWAAGIGITVAGAAVFFAVILHPIVPFLIQPVSLSPVGLAGAGFLGVGLAALGLLGLIGLYHLTVLFYKLTVKYLKFNLKIIKG